MVSLVVLTAAPAEVGPRPVLASALVNELRTALLLIASRGGRVDGRRSERRAGAYRRRRWIAAGGV